MSIYSKRVFGYRVRREITPYIDASAVLERLHVQGPVWFYDAALGGPAGDTQPTNDRHCVLVDLATIRRLAEDMAAGRVNTDNYDVGLVHQQLPDGVPFTFENLLRADIAHELSHLAEHLDLDTYLLGEIIQGYGGNPSEVHARACGRELFGLVRITDLVALS